MYYRDFWPTEADTSTIEIIAILLGFLAGSYVLWKGYQHLFGNPYIKMHIADTVDLVLGIDGLTNSFHLGYAFENRGSKTGVVQYIDAKVVDPHRNEGKFKWEIFVQYDKESLSLRRIPLSFRHAIPVQPKNTEFNLIQFSRLDDDNSRFDWMVGRYSFEIRLWVNKKSRDSDPNVSSKFQATLRKISLSVATSRGRNQSIFHWMCQNGSDVNTYSLCSLV